MSGGTDAIRVLHVDDEPAVADLVATFLEREDDRFSVEAAESAEAGLERLGKESFDCVVSDYEMPGRDGIEFLEAVRASHPELPFLLFTGRGSEEVASEAISAGVTEYLQKGTGTEQYELLANRITNVVEAKRSQQLLRKRTRRLETLISNLPGMVYRCRNERDWRMETVEGEVSDLTGYTADELESNAVSWGREVLHPDDREEMWEAVQAQLDEDEYFEVTYRIITEGGDTRWMWERGRTVATEGGDPVLLEGFITDITDRKERKLELERYEAYLQESTDIITVMDDAGEIKYQSPSAERILGYDQEALIGENGFEYIHPDDTDDLFARFSSLVEDPEGTVTEEARFRTADSEWRWLEIRGTNQLDNDAIEGIVTNSRDITERKRRQQDLERTGDLLDATERIADVGGWEIDPDSMDVFWTENLFDLLGVDRETAPSFEASLEHYHEEDRPVVETAIETAIEDGEPFDVEVRAERPDGGYRWLRVRGEPTIEDGAVVSLRGAIQDVTDTRERERELERQNERLDEFASLVSHDLRNPLNVARGRLELLREDVGSGNLESVDDALGRMDRIIEDVLRIAREGGDVEATEPIDLRDAIEDAWEITAHDDPEAELTVSEDGLGRIEADGDRLRHLLENLFDNAVEHASAGPGSQADEDRDEEGVVVTVGSLGDGFYVADDGPGIPPGEREEVFEEGYSTADDGTGFGLNIVEQVAEGHGWEITVTESDAGGARFEITGVERAR